VHIRKWLDYVYVHIGNLTTFIYAHIQKWSDFIYVHIRKRAASIYAHIQSPSSSIYVHILKRSALIYDTYPLPLPRQGPLTSRYKDRSSTLDEPKWLFSCLLEP
jgi:hypothetical protein